jgi:hypothetical protein
VDAGTDSWLMAFRSGWYMAYLPCSGKDNFLVFSMVVWLFIAYHLDGIWKDSLELWLGLVLVRRR